MALWCLQRKSRGERRAEQGSPTESPSPLGTDTDRAGGKWCESGQGGDVCTSLVGCIGFRADRGQFQAIEHLSVDSGNHVLCRGGLVGRLTSEK